MYITSSAVYSRVTQTKGIANMKCFTQAQVRLRNANNPLADV